MKNWIFGAGAVLCLSAGGLAVYQKVINDRQPPEILIEGEIVYQDGMQSGLLEGVTAKDAQEGDVTASLVVESVKPNAKNETAVIVYAARDSRNNITKVSRVVSYVPADASGSEDAAETESAEADSEKTMEKGSSVKAGLGVGLGNTVGTVSKEKDETSEDGQNTDEEMKEESETETDLETESEELDPACPVVKLTQQKATIKKGETFNPLVYVASIEDDYDNIYELWQNIQLEGEYDSDKAGKYDLSFYVVDSSGNRSNRAKFVLQVEE